MDRFRPDLEGLRGVAIAAVLLFHVGIPGFTGGFVGVDVFFVLSGFLITGLIVREIGETGALSFAGFYARRARRLLPAALVCLAATLVASAILLPPLRVRDVAGDGIAAALYVSNFRFAAEATDYFLAHLDPSPLLHYWSLGVEEQFYLVWPALLLVAARWRGVAGIAFVVGVLGIASLVLSIWLTGVSQPWAFFSFPTRAWQLCLGAALALAAARSISMRPAPAAVAGALGLGLIAAASVLIGPDLLYPGAVALVPAGGSALVIAAGLGRTISGPSRLLALRPVRWLGRISYSLYLWHWPLLVLPVAVLGSSFGPKKRIAVALAAVIIAALSHRFVEEPVHRGRLSRLDPRRTLATAGAATLVVALLAAVSWPLSALRPWQIDVAGAPTGPFVGGTRHGPVPTDLIPPLDQARSDRPRTVSDGCHLAHLSTKAPSSCAYGVPDSADAVFLIGDSHANQWFPAIERIALDHRWRLVSLTKSGCAAVDASQWYAAQTRVYDECDVFREATIQRIALERPRLVVLSNRRGRQLMIDGKPVFAHDNPSAWSDALGRMVRRLADLADHVVVLGDTPRSNVDVPSCLSGHLDDAFACATPMSSAVDGGHLQLEAAAAQASGGSFVDPTEWVCPTDPCQAVLGSLLIYRDTDHITTAFSASLAPRLAAELPSP